MTTRADRRLVAYVKREVFACLYCFEYELTPEEREGATGLYLSEEEVETIQFGCDSCGGLICWERDEER